jgi:hypothetical protein
VQARTFRAALRLEGRQLFAIDSELVFEESFIYQLVDNRFASSLATRVRDLRRRNLAKATFDVGSSNATVVHIQRLTISERGGSARRLPVRLISLRAAIECVRHAARGE